MLEHLLYVGILGHIARGLFLAVLDVNSCIVIQQRLNDGFLKKKKKIKIPCYWNSIHDISPNISVTNDEVFGSYKGFRWNLFSPYPHLEARWRGVSPLLFCAFISIQVLTLSANSKAFTHCQNTSKCICHWVTKLSTCHFALQSTSFHMSKSALQVDIVIIK